MFVTANHNFKMFKVIDKILLDCSLTDTRYRGGTGCKSLNPCLEHCGLPLTSPFLFFIKKIKWQTTIKTVVEVLENR